MGPSPVPGVVGRQPPPFGRAGPHLRLLQSAPNCATRLEARASAYGGVENQVDLPLDEAAEAAADAEIEAGRVCRMRRAEVAREHPC